MGEIIEEAKDFFEDIFEHLFETESHHNSPGIAERTRLAYQFTERIDGLMKIIFGISVIVSAVISSIWGFPAFGDLVRGLVENVFGRIALSIIGISYLVNGFWRMFHIKH